MQFAANTLQDGRRLAIVMLLGATVSVLWIWLPLAAISRLFLEAFRGDSVIVTLMPYKHTIS